MRVGIVGSRIYTNKKKIKDMIFMLKEKYGDELEIVSGGCEQGADLYAKKLALELNIKYVEFPPLHHRPSVYCPEPDYLYNKTYHVRYFFMRNKQIAEYSDRIIAFIPKNHKSNGTENTLKHAKALGKPHIIIN